MKPIHTPVAIRVEFVRFDEPSARGSSGAARTLTNLRRRTGRPYSAIIEELLLAERARGLRSGTTVRS